MFGDRDVLASFVDELRKHENIEDLKRLLATTTAKLGISYFSYQVIRVGGMPGRLPYLISTYPPAWVERYSQLYLQDDPLTEDLPDRRLPFLWSEVFIADKLTAKQKDMVTEAQEHGLVNGLTVPIHGKNGEFATVNFVPDASGDANSTIAYYRHLLHLMALYYHDHAARILVDKAMSSPRQKSLLSPREKEVLQWTARGKSNWEISTVLGISEKSVEFHLDSARRKLQVHNRTHAVVKAIMLNQIRVD